MKIIQPHVELLVSTPDALNHIEKCGRICYLSQPKNDVNSFIRDKIKRGHESIIEHASASFKITCDRGVTHELVRHRICSFSQESTRYCNYLKDRFGREINVIMPNGMTDHQKDIWLDICTRIETAYMFLVETGMTPQIARSILPNALKTEIIVTTNFREWRHFLKLRTDKASHPQMIEIANMVLDVFKANWPVIVEDIVNKENV